MKLDLDRQPPGRSELALAGTLELGMPAGGPVTAEVTGELVAQNLESRVLLSGTLKAAGVTECGRCLEEFRIAWDVPVDLMVLRDVDTDETTETGEPTAAHIVKTKRGENAAAVVLEARVMGTPVEALCGFVWVPSRDPKQLPVCEKCKSVYQMYKAFNDGLRDTPQD